MAVELETFLSEQLKDLPADHPDRKFLRGIQLTTKSYLETRPTPEHTIFTRATHAHPDMNKVDDESSIAGAISAWRAERGITITELAKRCGTSREYISMLEHNRIKHPREDRIARLAEGLEIDVATLITRQLPQKEHE